ncbi:hypothetical protein MBLNU230_g7917t1 [Neophaeotheca triangularis]
MRRRSTQTYIHLAIFLSILFYILSHHHQTPNKTFAWNTIRYQTTAKTLPSPHGTCPGLDTTSKPALVVARTTSDGDPAWLDALATKYHLCVYTVDSDDAEQRHASPFLRVPANRGHEAMPYLTFLIDNYDHFPSAGAVFIHGSRFAWHNDSPNYDNQDLLTALDIPAALEPHGYHNLKCDWGASMCPEREAKAQGSLETKASRWLQPYDARARSDALLPGALEVLFGGDGARVKPGANDAVRAQCCAQFVVSRTQVWRHTREEYVALRQWLLDSGREAAPSDDRVAGRIVSYLWHVLFMPQGEGVDLGVLNRDACPSAEACYCRLYGRCGLPGCSSPGRCVGQYSIPPGFKLPVRNG